jgi:Fanconi anemia group M protein
MTRDFRDLSAFVDKKQTEPKLDLYVKGSETQATPNDGKVVIIVDTREAGSRVVKELGRYDAKLDLKTLEVGDFVLSERVVVERKTSHDFSTSIIDGRLFSQAISLKSSYEKPLFLIEGGTLYMHRNIRPEAVMGAVSSLLIDYDIPIIWTENPMETALLLFSMARREQLTGKRLPRIRSEKKPLSLQDVQKYIVAGLPYVDTVLAKRLLKAFGTIEKVFLAAERELQSVDGIGKKKSQRIREVITARYKEEGS